MNATQTTEPKATDVTLHDFLSTLYGATQDDFRVHHGDDTTDAGNDLAAVLKAAGAEPIYVSLITANGDVPFLFTRLNYAAEDAWADFTDHQPTAALHRTDDLGNGTLVCAFALAEAARADDPAVVALSQAMGCDLTDMQTDFMATPGANDWRLVHFDKAAITPIDDLMAAYCDEPATPVVEPAGLEKWRDATVHAGFDPEADDMLAPVVITLGPSSKAGAGKWKATTMTRAQVFELFTRHQTSAFKDGPAAVLGDVEGSRGADNVRSLSFVGLDVDNGFAGDEIARRITDAGLSAVLASTHSHLKTTTTEAMKGFVEWAAEHFPGRELDDEIMRARMAWKGYDQAIVDSMVFDIVEAGQNRDGTPKLKVNIDHAPIPKWRVIVPLAAPFVIAENGATQDEGVEAWRAVPRALARLLGGLPIDDTGCDANRLFYLPSHAAGAEWRIAVFGGDLLDWRAVVEADHVGEPTVEPRARKRGAACEATGPLDERWVAKKGEKLLIVDLIRKFNDPRAAAPDRLIRGKDAEDKVHIRCPFEDDHSKTTARDKGCFVQNPGVSHKAKGFVISCSHHACHNRDRIEHLNKMVTDDWFAAEDVEAACNMVVEDESPADNDVDVEAALAEYAGLPPPQMAGGVAIASALKIDLTEPEQCLFDGPNAEAEAVEAMGRVASVVSLGNKVRIATRTKDGLTFYVKTDAGLWFSSYRALLEVGQDKDGQPKVKEFAALDLLLKSDKVKRYAGIDCDPSGSLPDYILNTWEGIKIAPAPGDCSLLLEHILESTCAGNAEHYKVLIQFFAHMFQKPNEKPGFAPVVIGPRGAGKSTVADFLRRAIGKRHSVKIAQGKHLVGNFNAHLSGRLLVQAEEVTFGGDKKGEGPLKDAITSPTTLTEPKGFDPYEETSFTRFFLVTNPGHAVPAGDGERRWFVLKVRDLFEGKAHDHPDRTGYFDALRAEADAGGIAAFLHYLVNDVDISDFKPWAPPVTDALGDQVRQSFGDEEFWIEGILESGLFKTRDGEESIEEWGLDEPLVIPSAVVIASYNSHVKRFGGSSGGSGAARRALEAHGEVGIGKTSVQQGRKPAYTLGTRREWRDRWMAKFGTNLREEG